MDHLIPVVGLAGFSKSGKTTFLEQLVTELKERGYRVGVIKHTHHPVTLDQPGTDSWRHTQAGATMVALAAPGCISVIKPCAGDPDPEQVMALFDGVDLIIIEGYKQGKWPKLQIYHRHRSEMPEVAPVERLAVISAVPQGDACFRLGMDDVAETADLLETVVLGRM
jgi:molybdopterin-guanine dinucleotide biosynthesis protein B